MRRSSALIAYLLPLAALQSQAAPPFQVAEASIADIHRAITAGRVSCRLLVTMYLERVAAYDKAGPAINALVLTNAHAIDVAD